MTFILIVGDVLTYYTNSTYLYGGLIYIGTKNTIWEKNISI